MDNRITLNVDETFLTILESSFEQKEKVSLLLDEKALFGQRVLQAIHKRVIGISIELEDEKNRFKNNCCRKCDFPA